MKAGKEIAIKNFDTFFGYTPHCLLIAVKTGISFRHFQILSTNIKIMARIITIHSQELLVICVYKPPLSSNKDFLQELSTILEQNRTHTILVGGDFNMQPVDNLAQLTAGLELSQVIMKATHIHGRMLDHVYVPRQYRDGVSGVMPIPYIDHH